MIFEPTIALVRIKPNRRLRQNKKYRFIQGGLSSQKYCRLTLEVLAFVTYARNLRPAVIRQLLLEEAKYAAKKFFSTTLKVSMHT